MKKGLLCSLFIAAISNSAFAADCRLEKVLPLDGFTSRFSTVTQPLSEDQPIFGNGKSLSVNMEGIKATAQMGVDGLIDQLKIEELSDSNSTLLGLSDGSILVAKAKGTFWFASCGSKTLDLTFWIPSLIEKQK